MTSRSHAKARTTTAGHERRLLPVGMAEAIVGLSRHAVVLSVVSAAVFLAMTALEFLYFQRLSGGLPSLDLRVFGFTPDEGMAWMTALGRRGSEIIIVWHYLTFDLLFPALLSLTLIAAFLAVGERLTRFDAMSTNGKALFALGLVAPYTLCDYAQNLAVVRLLSDFLSANPDTLSLASALIVAKFFFGVIPVIAIAVLYLAGQRQKQAR